MNICLLIAYYGHFLKDFLIECTQSFQKNQAVTKIDQAVTKIRHTFSLLSYVKRIYKAVDPHLSSKPKEIHGSWFIYGTFLFKKNPYTLYILKIYS